MQISSYFINTNANNKVNIIFANDKENKKKHCQIKTEHKILQNDVNKQQKQVI